ncbi:hypothetical protein BGZ76_000963 [Entomortierella beljakovae]|nr:hypothetical protein BGZ76_000963 [Entomortierella beljakovae]
MLELGAYFTGVQLQPKHMIISLRTVMTACYRVKNLQTAQIFARRLLELAPPGHQAITVARQIQQAAERNPRDEIRIDYDQYNAYKICAASYTPIYQGSPSVQCPYCHAHFKPEFSGNLCTICDISRIGGTGTGMATDFLTNLVSTLNITFTYFREKASIAALYIAEVLAGCAACIVVVACICCFYSGAARRRFRQEQVNLVDSYPIRRRDDENSTGRRTPDAAPAYSATSPLGPLSPEMVDAISSASAEYRQSLVISLLSSNQTNVPDSPSIGVGAITAQHSSASSIDEYIPIHLLGSPPRSQMTNDWSYEDAGEPDANESNSSPMFSRELSSLPPRLTVQTPPSYNTTCRHVPTFPQRLFTRSRNRSNQSCNDQPLRYHSRDNSQSVEMFQGPEIGQWQNQTLRLGPNQGSAQRCPRNQSLLSFGSHRHTGSLNTPMIQPDIHNYCSQVHPRGLVMNPGLTVARRPLSWTGSQPTISFNRVRAASNDPPSQRSNTGSSWPLTMEEAVISN